MPRRDDCSVLRDLVGLTGTKFGCGIALCGACKVHADGVAVRSCVLSSTSVADKAITTIEGVGDTPVGEKVQAVWLRSDVVHCGYNAHRCRRRELRRNSFMLGSKRAPPHSPLPRLNSSPLERPAAATL
jgi:isoquinoline 1-oxidoreductase subunit alpha